MELLIKIPPSKGFCIFSCGDLLFSDVNWWRGSTDKGEGLFPTNFVTADLNAEPESKLEREVQTIYTNRDLMDASEILLRMTSLESSLTFYYEDGMCRQILSQQS